MSMTDHTSAPTPRSPGQAWRSLATTAFVIAAVWPLHAAVLATLWLWFAVPALEAPAISTGEAAGLIALIRFIFPAASRPAGESTRRWAFGLLLWPIVSLAVGALIRLLIGGAG